MLPHEISGLGYTLRDECGLELFEPCKDSSKFFKRVFNNSPRIVRKKHNV